MLNVLFPSDPSLAHLVTRQKALGLLVTAGFSFDYAVDLLMSLKVARKDWTDWYFTSDVQALTVVI